MKTWPQTTCHRSDKYFIKSPGGGKSHRNRPLRLPWQQSDTITKLEGDFTKEHKNRPKDTDVIKYFSK